MEAKTVCFFRSWELIVMEGSRILYLDPCRAVVVLDPSAPTEPWNQAAPFFKYTCPGNVAGCFAH